MAARSRVLMTVSTEWEDGSRFRLTLDAPRGDWPVEELHEMARVVADVAGITSEITTSLRIALTWPDTAGASLG